jgi:hypothetical protein
MISAYVIKIELNTRLIFTDLEDNRVSINGLDNVTITVSWNSDIVESQTCPSTVLFLFFNPFLDFVQLVLHLNDIGRSHPIGQTRDGKISIIVRFLTYRQRAMVFSNKKKLKGNKDKIFICENLTKHQMHVVE